MRNLIIAAVVALVLIIIAVYVYMARYTVKLTISSMQVLSDGAITLNATSASAHEIDPKKWVGFRIAVHSKSLGRIDSVVSAAQESGSTLIVSTVPGAYSGKASYKPAASDYARIMLK